MRTDFSSNSANIWEALYEKAITEPDVQVRRQRLLAAQDAILERARAMEEEPGDHEIEAQALEEAANFVREMKLQTQTDGVGMDLDIGSKEDLPRKGATVKDTPTSRTGD